MFCISNECVKILTKVRETWNAPQVRLMNSIVNISFQLRIWLCTYDFLLLLFFYFGYNFFSGSTVLFGKVYFNVLKIDKRLFANNNLVLHKSITFNKHILLMFHHIVNAKYQIDKKCHMNSIAMHGEIGFHVLWRKKNKIK